MHTHTDIHACSCTAHICHFAVCMHTGGVKSHQKQPHIAGRNLIMHAFCCMQDRFFCYTLEQLQICSSVSLLHLSKRERNYEIAAVLVIKSFLTLFIVGFKTTAVRVRGCLAPYV